MQQSRLDRGVQRPAHSVNIAVKPRYDMMAGKYYKAL